MLSDFESPLDWFMHMQTSGNYLSIERMQEGMAYSIWARNAYVGIWLPDEQGFLISRYKMHPAPFLFVEHHWDTGEPNGTVKPLRPLEICPLTQSPRSAYRDEVQNAALCAWLEALETRYPPCPGWDTVKERREANEKWRSRMSDKKRGSDHSELIHKLRDRLP